jgi:hypothetical protein
LWRIFFGAENVAAKFPSPTIRGGGIMSNETVFFQTKGKKLGCIWFSVILADRRIGTLEVGDNGDFYYFYADRQSNFIFAGRTLAQIAAKLAELNRKWEVDQAKYGGTDETTPA